VVIERGQIFWCGLDPVEGHEQGATRPVVIVSADSYNS
jgi:mRNA-degrading endonuclease toxin of MazEF toxin-antitoxin module